jgi:hypothetical protein
MPETSGTRTRTPLEQVLLDRVAAHPGEAISGKGRRMMQAMIDGYVASRGLQGREAVVVGNHVRGFLIHNGVFIQGPVSIS